MCLGVPMRVVSTDGSEGLVEVGGVRRQVRLDLTPDAPVGSYVVVHAGYAIQVLDEAAAAQTLEILEQAGFRP